MKKIAIVCAQGIGDALILSIASRHLQQQGHEVTTFSRHLPLFKNWLIQGSYEQAVSHLDSFDTILLQHDNSEIARHIVGLRKINVSVYIFYTNYRESKHGPLLKGFDFPFNENKTMVENTVAGLRELFGGTVLKFNALQPPSGLFFRKYPKRIAIHPTSTSEEKNWPREKFLKLAKKLSKNGFEPVFTVAPHEQSSWPSSPKFPSLADLAAFLYESGGFIGNDSGPAHLASYLSIPALVISGQERRARLWRPGWGRTECIYGPRYLPNFKYFRLREEKWKYFITTKGVINRFHNLLKLKQ